MFRGSDQIEPVVELLEAREVSLWHACQLRDLRSYLGVGGIPSRSLLEQSRLDFTPFVTDATDRSAGVWSKVFLNLSDFGAAFAHGAEAIPNPYGPIVLQIHPRALRRSSDVALCLRSAGARDFDRDSESLSSVDDVERLFHNPIWAPFPESTFTLYGTRLKERFDPRYPEATSPELSISMEPELIPLEDVVVVWVDPIEIDATTLLASTDEAAKIAGWSPRLRTRDTGDARRLVLADVVRYLLKAHGPPSLRGLAGRSDVEEVTREWATTVLGRDLDWQFKRYAGYLLEGTLREMVGVSAEPTARAAEAPAAYTADGRPPSYRLPMS
jgi:hypothetical protein